MKGDFVTIYGRYRKAAGYTQEYAAEALGVSTRTIAAWESGESIPPDLRVMSMVDLYHAPSLGLEHLRATSAIGRDVLPAVTAVPLPQAVCQLCAAMRQVREAHAEDELLEIAADGRVSELETSKFAKLVEDLEPVMAAVLSLKLAEQGA